MRLRLIFISVLALLLASASMTYSSNSQSSEIRTNAKVCANPSMACSYGTNQYPVYALSFQLPKKLEWQKNYYSANFYALILKSISAVVDGGPDTKECLKGCISEAERKRVQAMFPANKVFASRFGCYMEMVWYTNTNSKYNFLAVYAGDTQSEAAQFLVKVKATGQFPSANIRRMQVVLGNGD